MSGSWVNQSTTPVRRRASRSISKRSARVRRSIASSLAVSRSIRRVARPAWRSTPATKRLRGLKRLLPLPWAKRTTPAASAGRLRVPASPTPAVGTTRSRSWTAAAVAFTSAPPLRAGASVPAQAAGGASAVAGGGTGSRRSGGTQGKKGRSISLTTSGRRGRDAEARGLLVGEDAEDDDDQRDGGKQDQADGPGTAVRDGHGVPSGPGGGRRSPALPPPLQARAPPTARGGSLSLGPG